MFFSWYYEDQIELKTVKRKNHIRGNGFIEVNVRTA